MRSTTNVVSGRNFRIFISMPEASPKPRQPMFSRPPVGENPRQ
jgi:hypothetical protein